MPSGAVSREITITRAPANASTCGSSSAIRATWPFTPDVCYRGSGFEARGKENSLYPLVMLGMPDTPMWTNTFFKEDVSGRSLLRVFWTWYNPESADNEGKIVWEAPSNARFHFGNSRALYKMYFTSEMRSDGDG